VLFEQRAEHDPDVFFVIDDQNTAHGINPTTFCIADGQARKKFHDPGVIGRGSL
jgi:hypothetical protein